MKSLLSFLGLFIAFGFISTNYAQGSDSNQKNEKVAMHRYVVERTFPDGLNIPMDEVGKDICLNVVSTNAEDMVSWVHSYVTKDKKKTFCIYDAPSADAIKRAAKKNKLPVDNITEVSVLEPYFYK